MRTGDRGGYNKDEVTERTERPRGLSTYNPTKWPRVHRQYGKRYRIKKEGTDTGSYTYKRWLDWKSIVSENRRQEQTTT